jgi:hypothetical protein
VLFVHIWLSLGAITDGKASAQQTHRRRCSRRARTELPEPILSVVGWSHDQREGTRTADALSDVHRVWTRAARGRFRCPEVRSCAWARRTLWGRRVGAGCILRMGMRFVCTGLRGHGYAFCFWCRSPKRDEGEIALCGVPTDAFGYLLYHMYATVWPHKSYFFRTFYPKFFCSSS